MRIVERILTTEQDGLPGYLAHPDRIDHGPGLLLIHQNTGVSGYLKIEAYKFARLGYTTLVPNLYELCGHPDLTHIKSGREIQRLISDAEFNAAATKGWDYLLARPDVDPERVAAGGYCMGGRIGINFVAATPAVRCFVCYYPTIRDEPPTELRPRTPFEVAPEIRCPCIVLYGGQDSVTPTPIQERVWDAFVANGQRLEWHYFPFGGHGFADPDASGYYPHAAELSWPLVVDFLARELDHYPS
jgi:carboxymethylenebutenolidase